MFAKKMTIKQAILTLFFISFFLFLTITLSLQYYFSNNLVNITLFESILKTAKNTSYELNSFESKVKNGINLIELGNDVNIPFYKDITHPVTKKMAIFMENNPYTLAIYFGYDNGDFFELINLDVHKDIKKRYGVQNDERWLVVKIFNNFGKPKRYEEYLDKDLNVLRKNELSSDYDSTTRPWYIKAKANKGIVQTSPYAFMNFDSLGITYAKNLENRVVLAIDISLKTLEDFFDNQTDIKDSSFLLINSFDNKIISSNSKLKDEDIVKIKENFSEKQNFIKDKIEYLITISEIKTNIDLKQELILLTPKKEAFKIFYTHAKIFLAIIAVFLLFMLPFILIFINSLNRPINEIIVENEKIKNRDFVNVNLVFSKIKELNELSISLFNMSKDIKRKEEELNNLIDSIIELISNVTDKKSPYTGEHCKNVPILTMMIAQSVSNSKKEVFKDFALKTPEELRELNVAAKLHDCGKITIPDYIVDKAVRLEILYNRIHEIRTRFEVVFRDYKIKYLEDVLAGKNKDEAKKELDKNFEILQSEFEFIASCNSEEKNITRADIEKIKQIAKREWIRYFDDSLGLSNKEKNRYIKPSSNIENLLSNKQSHKKLREQKEIDEFLEHGFKMDIPKYIYNFGEIYNLCIERGTINIEERFKINEHIITTIKMLENLPFPKNLSKVAEYAGNHHETLDGTGYPRKLIKEQMSLASRMMVIADIFEALTARSRPYKDAKTLSQTLAIMKQMVEEKHIDKDLFEIFIEDKIYLTYAKKHLKKEQIDIN